MRKIFVGRDLTLRAYSDLYLGGYVGFTTNAVGPRGNQWAMVKVQCTQGVQVVWASGASPSRSTRSPRG